MKKLYNPIFIKEEHTYLSGILNTDGEIKISFSKHAINDILVKASDVY